jgi:hypothetical protein
MIIISIQIISSLVDFEGQIEFINNTGDSAVAMHLISFGQARLLTGLRMIFIGNNGT